MHFHNVSNLDGDNIASVANGIAWKMKTPGQHARHFERADVYFRLAVHTICSQCNDKEVRRTFNELPVSNVYVKNVLVDALVQRIVTDMTMLGTLEPPDAAGGVGEGSRKEASTHETALETVIQAHVLVWTRSARLIVVQGKRAVCYIAVNCEDPCQHPDNKGNKGMAEACPAMSNKAHHGQVEGIFASQKGQHAPRARAYALRAHV